MKFEVGDFEMMETALHALCEFLAQQNIADDTVFDSRLISCELLSNVLQHSKGRAFFSGVIAGEYIEIQVDSTERYLPPEYTTCSDVYADSGRGLFLVDSLSDRRENTAAGGIKVYIKTIYKPDLDRD